MSGAAMLNIEVEDISNNSCIIYKPDRHLLQSKDPAGVDPNPEIWL